MFRQGLVLVMAFGLLAGLGFGQEQPTDLMPPGGIGMNVIAISPVIPGVPVRLEAFFRSGVFLDTMAFVFTPSGAIQYSGQTEWRHVVNPGDSLVFPLEVTFPKDDTTGFEIATYIKVGRFIGIEFYVASTGDSVKTFSFDPRTLPKDEEPRYSEEYWRLIKTPRLLHEWGDTTKVKVSTHKASDWELMKIKERTPLTDADEQHIIVDGETWYRKRGEYEFQKLKQYASPQERVRVREAELNEKYKDVKRDMIIDLRNPADYDFVKELVGNGLQPMDSVGFYRGAITKSEGGQLSRRKIRYSMYPKYPREIHELTPAEQDSARQRIWDRKKSLAPVPRQNPKDVLLNYDFETWWYYDWSYWDENEENGRDYWYDVTSDSGEVHSGDFSLWCAAEGNMPDGVQYDDFMWSWLEYTHGGIYIGGHDNVKLKYWLWYETETNYDFFEVYWCYDGQSWNNYSNNATGYSSGWEEFTLDIPKEGDSLYIAFLFYSDYDYCDYRGVFLDDISLTGDAIADLPNLTWTTPYWWDAPIVPSSVTGTNVTGNLCGNAPTYIDVAVINEGTVTAAPFSVALYIDGGILDTVFECYSYLLPGLDTYFEDHKDYISQGYHSLTMKIDNDSLIHESCETDNVYEKTFYWSAPGTITVNGTTAYRDMNPPTVEKVARKVRVELWDDDDIADDLLASTWAADNGNFSMGPVSNADELWSGRQDIYLKIYAENDAAYVDQGHNGNRVFYQTSTQSEAPDGTYYYGVVNVPGPQSGPFFMRSKTEHHGFSRG